MHGQQITLDELLAERIRRDRKENRRQNAAAKRDAAMDSVAAHADENAHGWTTQAMAHVRKYAEEHEQFIAEECAEQAYSDGLQSEGIDGRAWGKIYKRAAKEGLIVAIGWGISPNRNNSPTRLWKSLNAKFSNSNVVKLSGAR